MAEQFFDRAASIQHLVSDVGRVSRNHRIPGTERHESVVEHSFGSCMLAWRMAEELELQDLLDMGKVFKYIMIHDFTERGLVQDYNAYRHAGDHVAKQAYEAEQQQALLSEFADFAEFTEMLQDYDAQADDEAWFAETVEKTQAIILDHNDSWRAHIAIGASLEDYVAHHAGVLERAYPPTHTLVAEIIEAGRQSYEAQLMS